MPAEAIVKGDGKCSCIAAASIIAKVRHSEPSTRWASCHVSEGLRCGRPCPHSKARLASTICMFIRCIYGVLNARLASTICMFKRCIYDVLNTRLASTICKFIRCIYGVLNSRLASTICMFIRCIYDVLFWQGDLQVNSH